MVKTHTDRRRRGWGRDGDGDSPPNSPYVTFEIFTSPELSL